MTNRRYWWLLVGLLFCQALPVVKADDAHPSMVRLEWNSLADLPEPLGVAGPFVGVHEEALVVAGGANFPKPVWENEKQWLDQIYVYTKTSEGETWTKAGRLSRPMAYGAGVSTRFGIVCMGGNQGDEFFDDVFLLQWNSQEKKIIQKQLPSLPKPCAYGQAALIGDVIFLAGGQSAGGLDSAMSNFWSLDIAEALSNKETQWKILDSWPGPSRAFNLTVAQHNGYFDCVYVMSGRSLKDGKTTFLKDVWEYTPALNRWRQRGPAPRCVMAGTAVAYGQSHVFVLGGADGSLFDQGDALKLKHPGFPKEALMYHTITDTWVTAGKIPQNQVTTIPVIWDNDIILASGEIKPRIRTPAVWRVRVKSSARSFGVINYIVLFGYLLLMVLVGVYFAWGNRDTNDFFRGGLHIPWWAAGCSIFATMLSSLTFTGVPSKAFAQDWVYAVGNMMIPVVAFVGVYIALPFYRRLDVTSAYEYLEKRFNRAVRLFGSASFTLFHLFRMAVVMSLTGLALAVATPLTPGQCVLLMGGLSILYCTMGGIEAVIWTDTIQTVVLLGGAILAFVLLIAGTDGGMMGAWRISSQADKMNVANFHMDYTSAQLALWVIVLGALGQNTASYTADQAVVQRYMTTPSEKLAARAIWTNALLTIPATFLFFGIGTALFAFYHSHPGRLDPTISTDQIFPLFVATEMPVGLAGLIVAGIFSAAQSTVSTSMNSTATTIVTDFVRPFDFLTSETSYLRLARSVTFLMGVMGTLLALVFVDPDIRSLFDAFIKVIGLFMGVLGGLFILGTCTTRAHGTGALVGAFCGALGMFLMWRYSNVNGYLYTVSGMSICFVVGYFVSLMLPGGKKDISGLTVYRNQSQALGSNLGASP